MFTNTRGICASCAEKKLQEYQSQPHEYAIGDFVKSRFTGGEHPEWMWARITSIDDTSITGVLDNDPLYAPLRCGDEVTVLLSDISDHLYADLPDDV